MAPWDTSAAKRIYGIDEGYHKYFLDINREGHLVVKIQGKTIDLYKLVSEGRHGTAYVRILPLIGFFMEEVVGAFKSASAKHGCPLRFQPVYPLKTNSEEIVLDAVDYYGSRYGWGYNVGSVGELESIRGFIDNPRIIIADGVKDEEFISILGEFKEKGWRVIVDIEDERDLDLVGNTGFELGLRLKLLTTSSGKWAKATGIESKFGLNILGLEELADEYPWIKEKAKLLHIHPGSQIEDRGVIEGIVSEATGLYRELRSEGFKLELLDFGGGLPYPYFKRLEYGIRDYADIIVGKVKADLNCEPTIVFEGGRFIVAAHRIVVTRILSVRPYGARCSGEVNYPMLEEIDAAKTIGELRSTVRKAVEITTRLKISSPQTLEQRRFIEEFEACVSEAIAVKARRLLNERPEEIRELVKYYNYLLEFLVSPSKRFVADFSVFRDLPDLLVADEYFRVIPVQGLDRAPDYLGVISDRTCDTMGEYTVHYSEDTGSDPFFTQKDNRLIAVPGMMLRLNGVPLHDPRGLDYYVAFLDTGAYQDMLKMNHNRVGDAREIIIGYEA